MKRSTSNELAEACRRHQCADDAINHDRKTVNTDDAFWNTSLSDGRSKHGSSVEYKNDSETKMLCQRPDCESGSWQSCNDLVHNMESESIKQHVVLSVFMLQFIQRIRLSNKSEASHTDKLTSDANCYFYIKQNRWKTHRKKMIGMCNKQFQKI